MSLPIQSATGRLTDEQKQLVEDHIPVAERAERWLARPYRLRGWSRDEAKCDALWFLAISALRYDSKINDSFSAFYMAQIKWWRSDVLRYKPAQIKRWAKTISINHVASTISSTLAINEINCLAVEDNDRKQMDQLEQEQHIKSLILRLVPQGQIFLDFVNGMRHHEISEKYGLSDRRQATRVICRARKYIIEFLMDRLFS